MTKAGAQPGVAGQDVRIALILNGGVSLAVWMGGVVQEIDVACRASRELDPAGDGSPAEQALFDKWKEICRGHGHSTLTVDIVAGSSAGGLNGSLLAAAVANGNPLSGLREVWLDDGQIAVGSLLPSGNGGLASVLDGKFFESKVCAQLKRLSTPRTSLHVGVPENEMTLFVTATALASRDRSMEDAAGSQFTEADNRRRYRFRTADDVAYENRGEGWEFVTKPNTAFQQPEALARAARASAGFPAAFEPVSETEELIEQRVWPLWLRSSELSWLSDGGIIDNAPFEPVLEEIATRHSTGPRTRAVCYVVPSDAEAGLSRIKAEQSTRAEGDVLPEALRPPWTTVVARAIGLPRQADFRDDIEYLDRLITTSGPNGAQTLFNRVWASELSANPAEELSGELLAAAAACFPLFQASHYIASLAEFVRDYARRNGLRDLVPDTMDPFATAAPNCPWVPPAFEWTPGKDWRWGIGTAERVVRMLLRYQNLQNRSQDASNRCNKLSTVIARLRALREAVLQRQIELIKEASEDWRNLSTIYDEAGVAVLVSAYSELDACPKAGELVREALIAFGPVYANGAEPPEPDLAPLMVCLGIEVVGRAAQTAPVDDPCAPFTFYRVGPDVDSPVLPIPPTAPAQNKLYGTRLGHFGAFGDPDWRKWDWMWGRVDGVAHLGGVLGLTVDEVRDLQQLVIQAEGLTLDDVSSRLNSVLSAENPALLDEFRKAQGGQRFLDLLNSILRFLRGSSDGIPPPPPVSSVGSWVQALLARQNPGGLSGDQSFLRVLIAPIRWCIWRRVRKATK